MGQKNGSKEMPNHPPLDMEKAQEIVNYIVNESKPVDKTMGEINVILLGYQQLLNNYQTLWTDYQKAIGNQVADKPPEATEVK